MSLLSPVAQGVTLKTAHVAGVQLETCPVSGGIWIGNEELERFDDVLPPAAAMDDIVYDPCFEGDTGISRVSPIHPDSVMDRHVFGHRHPIEIDTCPVSGGMWLDRGEIERIRHYYTDPDDLQELAAALDHELAESAGETDSTLRYANLFRWICVQPIARAS